MGEYRDSYVQWMAVKIDRLRAELAREHPVTGWTAADMDHAVESWQVATARYEKAEAAIARVRALCGADPFAHEHATLDDEKPAVYRCIPEQYVLRALDGE